MKGAYLILYFLVLVFTGTAKERPKEPAMVRFDFYGERISFIPDSSFLTDLPLPFSDAAVNVFLNKVNASAFNSCMDALNSYKTKFAPDDWLYYQLVRKTAQQISPKAANYQRYTLYKYFLMAKSGYDVLLSISGEKLLFYVQSDENIYNIPYRLKNGRQFICLNFHDFENLDITKEKFEEVGFELNESKKSFSYSITKLPDFPLEDYIDKEINFNYYQLDFHFKVKLNPVVKNIFANYPVVDYSNYFNIPLSTETYKSLIPVLKNQVKKMNTGNGVDYLMRFTRYAFSFESDAEHFGGEKRLSPEQTLLYDKSDCDDRAGLFFYLVKEIYNLPMIVLSYPKHVTIAVQLDKPVGKPIFYNGLQYSICDPTPQKDDLAMGQLLPELKNISFEIVYAYHPVFK